MLDAIHHHLMLFFHTSYTTSDNVSEGVITGKLHNIEVYCDTTFIEIFTGDIKVWSLAMLL